MLIAILLIPFWGFSQEKVEVKDVNPYFKKLHTEIIIDATPEQVWTVLTDTKSYEDWGEFIRKVDGTICDKCSLYFFLDLGGPELAKIPHTIFVKKGKYFGWQQPFGGGIVDNHRFIIKRYGKNKTKFIQSDYVKGSESNWEYALQVFELEKSKYPVFNRSLKKEVERRFKK